MYMYVYVCVCMYMLCENLIFITLKKKKNYSLNRYSLYHIVMLISYITLCIDYLRRVILIVLY